MKRFPTIQSLMLAAVLAGATAPAHAIMARPELGGMGMTGYLSALMSECPSTPPAVAMEQNWRPGMPCVGSTPSGTGEEDPEAGIGDLVGEPEAN